MNRWLLSTGLGVLASGIVPLAAGEAGVPADWIAWQAARRKSIAGTNGWMTLAGLYWLAEGQNSAGTNPTNQILLLSGRAAGHIGVSSSFATARRVTPPTGLGDFSMSPSRTQTGAS